MWILSFFPDFVVHLILILGIVGVIAGFVLGFIPFISTYKLPIQIISILLLSLGLYLQGGLANEESWRMKVKELEAKVAEAKAKSEKVNTQIVTKIVTKDKIIKEKGDEIIKIVEKEVEKINNTCPAVPNIGVKIHNAAALNDPTLITIPKTEPEIKTDKENKSVNNTMILPKK